MSPRPRDYAYEALAEVTNSDMEGHRGELNAALRLIRGMTDQVDYELATAIRDHAARYRVVMGAEIMLTPGALAKHWHRVEAETQRKTGTNLTVTTDCSTCEDDRWVVVGTRPALDDTFFEEVAPCPDCNSTEIWFRRFDGTIFRSPDAAKTREMMKK
jgi:hypothetical protein